MAPAGNFVFTGSEAPSVVLIAGGVGITPLMSITRFLTDCCWPGRIDLVVAARKREHFIFHDELQSLTARFPNLRVHRILSNASDDAEWTGACGHLTQKLLRQWIDDWQTPVLYVCGPKPMMAGVVVLLADLGVEPARIKTEAFVSPASHPSAGPGTSVGPKDMIGTPPSEALMHFLRSSLERCAARDDRA